MPISGLVLGFDGPAQRFDQTLAAMRSHPYIEVGEVVANRCAIVLESTSKQQDQELWQWMRNLAGVVDIQVAFVGFDSRTEDHADSGAELTTGVET